MVKWNILPDFVAYLFVITVAINFFDEKENVSKNNSFVTCLITSIISVLVSSVSSIFLLYPAWIPPVYHSGLHMAKSFFMSLAGLFLYRHIILTAYEIGDLKREQIIIAYALYALSFLYSLVIFTNPFHHLFFTITREGYFVPGKLYQSEFLILIIYALVASFIYYRLNHRFEAPVRRMIVIGGIAALLVIVMQIAFPNTVFSGITVANSLMIVFICAQQTQINIDAQTGLHNRSSFLQTVTEHIRKNHPFTVIIVSPKHFRRINVRLGYSNGDRLLKKIGEFITTLPLHPTPYLISGVDFALILPTISEIQITEILNLILRRFEADWEIRNAQCSLNAGTATLVCSDCQYEGMGFLSNIDNALDALKKGEHVQHIRFSGAFKNAYEKKEQIIDLLQKAVADDLFFPVYQPVYSIADKAFSGCESLIRIKEPSGRIISPGEFIQTAEDTGLINDIGFLMVEKVCRFLQTCPPNAPSYVSVNISAQQFVKPSFPRFIQDMLQKYNVSPDRFKIEITERVLITDLDHTFENLRAFKQMGVGIFLDDFGTGYSNLFIIAQFSFECIKFDRSLIQDIHTNPNAYKILKAFVSAINKDETTILIEGVETQEQFERLCTLDIDLIQGYLFSKPLPQDDLLRSY